MLTQLATRKSKLYVIGLALAIVLGLIVSKMNYNEIGLGVLTWVKKVSGQAVDISALGSTQQALIKHDLWDEILNRYVEVDGNVKYGELLNNQIELDEYLSRLSQNPPGKNWNIHEQLAYWINAYNAFTVKLILNHYPLESIKDISSGLPMINSPWDIKFFKIGGVDFDLNTIEHQILRKLDEPRIHFAINCASYSCPVLRKEAYTAEQLETQLEHQTSVFINNPNKNKINQKETYISKIFDWFSSDFDSLGGDNALLKKYHSEFNDKNDIQYMDYDWSLNKA